MKTKLLCLSMLFALFSCTVLENKKESADVLILRKSCQYLWSQQGEDGGWHSQKHGLMKGGQSYTPFILLALMEVPDSIYEKPKDKIEKALDFIRTNTNKEGILGLADKMVLEYPNYSTAYALRVLLRYGNDGDKILIDKMKKYLIEQQFDEDRGINPKELSYGGWGFGETKLAKGEVGHIDLSHTRRILQALREAGHQDKETYKKALTYLSILQKNPADKRRQPLIDTTKNKKVPFDGGFYYSSVLLSANKAHQEPETAEYQAYFRSYATATSDGLLSLLASGEKKESESVQSALKWLLKYNNLNYPEGIPTDEENGWNLVMVFYHVAVRSEVYQLLQPQGNWKGDMIAFLQKRQREDGSFSNPDGARNKEDDPFLATTFAVMIANNTMKDPQ